MFLPMTGASVLLRRFVRRLLAAALLIAPAATQAAPVVDLGQQQLVGVLEDNGVASFRGIAYARPPIGALRWQAPRPPQQRRGRVDATRFGSICPQSEGNTRWYRNVAKAMGADPAAVNGPDKIDEDCLYLNVWSSDPRSLPAGRSRPVMVWIHGGSNENGYSHEPNYLGTNLAHQGVVVVSLNYRLGLLGFFAHPALGVDASGRQGLLDQVAALKWIKTNIARFGGDPSRITLFGESAGGTNIAGLAAMPDAQGLFAQVIVQSGYLASPAVTPRGAVMSADQAAKLASGLFAPTTNAASLRAMPWQAIVELQRQRLAGHFYAPAADLPAGLRVPVLIGSNADEYLMYLPKDPAGQETELASELGDYPPQRAAEIRTLFDRLPGNFANRVDAVSAGKAFHCPSARFADAAATGGQKAFVYRFARVRPGNHGLGAYHGAEIPYVFDTDDAWLPADATDRNLARTMQSYWVNFARSGDPNGPGLPAWPQWHAASRTAIGLGDAIAAKPMPLTEMCALLTPKD
jgi:para-nitrobenzyl esterase